MRKSSWKKPIVEGLTIIVSILLAFSIDAWWSDHVQRQEIHSAMEALHADFVGVVDELDRASRPNMRRRDAAIYLRQASRNELESLSSDSLQTLLHYTMIMATVDAKTATLNGLISSGRLSLISDQKLRDGIADWHQSLNDLMGTQELLIVEVTELYTPWLNSKVLLYRNRGDSPRYSPDYNSLISDFQFHNRLLAVEIRSSALVREIEHLKTDALDLIELLSKELARTA